MTEGISTAFPRALSQDPSSGRIFLRQDLLFDFKQRVLSRLELDAAPVDKSRRIFLARKSHAARPYNQAEISALAQDEGFEIHYLEDLSFRESVKLFTEAEAIAGPHGAGFANSIFASPGTRLLLWTWEDKRGDNWYETLFVASRLIARFIYVSPQPSEKEFADPRDARYYLSPQKFRDGLRTILIT